MKSIIKLLFVAGVAAAALTSRADTITWNGSVSSSWINPTNWTPQEVPTTNDHVIITSGTITVPASATFGILDWSGGTITGPLTVITNGVLNLNWSTLNTWSGPLTNAGVVNVTGAGQLNLASATINNLPGGVIDFKADQIWAGVPSATFLNAGLVRKAAGANLTQIGLNGFPVNFSNSGTVEANTGTITFNNGGLIDGAYQAATGAAVNFANGAFTPGSNPVITGTGTVEFTGTILTLSANVIPGLQMLGGTVTLGPAFQGGTITNLTLAGATLGGTNIVTGSLSLSNGMSGTLTVAGGATFNYNAGNLTGSVTVMTNGMLNLNGNSLITWTGSLTNAGVVNDNGAGQLNLDGGTINNLANGIVDFKANQLWAGVPSATFLNAGLVRKTAGTGLTQIGVNGGFPVNFSNMGTVEADTGTIIFNSGGLIDGAYQAATGATVNFAGGSFTANSPVITGAGTVEFTGTTLTLSANVIPGLQMLGGTVTPGPAFQGGTITNLTLIGATLSGTNIVTGTLSLSNGVSGALTVAGGATCTWSAGNLAGSVTVMTNGILNLNGNSLLTWNGSLTNTGVVNVNGAGQLNLAGGTINNLPGGIIDFKANQMWAGVPSATFLNAGLVRKTAGTGQTQIGFNGGFPVNFSNTGTVEADTGTITFNSGGLIDGAYQAATGATVNFASGAFTSGSNPVIAGTGTVEFTGTSLTLSANVIPGLQMLGGTVTPGPTFQGGTITNLTLLSAALGGTNIVTGTLSLSNGMTGTLTVAGGAVTVMAKGILNLDGNSTVTWNGSLTNAGLVNVNGGGQLNFAGGTINNLANGIIDFKTNQIWAGVPSATFLNAGLVRKTAGTGLTQIGINGSFPVNFSNTGTVEADTGIIIFNAGYSDTSGANIAFSLGSATPVTGFGLISFAAAPLLHANLVVSTRNGFVPSPGQTFKVLSYPSSTNQFNCISGLDLGGGILLQPQFSSTGLTLLTTAYSVGAVLPQLFINRSLGGVAITWPASFSSWTLQSATNLSSPAWIPVPGACGNEAQVSGIPPLYFRLKN